MNKQELLKEYRRQEDKLCIAQVLDKIENVEKKNKLEFTDFLDMYQISLVNTFLKKNKIQNYIMYGGYEEAERKILIIYPEKYNEDMIRKNYKNMIGIVNVKLPKENYGKYVHRNYLGGIVKLGLNREKVGDILVFEDGADIITVKSFTEILKRELGTLTRFTDSKITEREIEELRTKTVEVEEIKIIVPSLRLDNIVSDLAKTSRSKAANIIEQERVFVNGKNEIKVSKQIKLNDIITIRGKGRFVVKDLVGSTRSGRNVLLIEKFI